MTTLAFLGVELPTVASGPRSMLLGRTSECEVLEGLLSAVRDGRSRVAVLRGEPGVGKTALLQRAVASASCFRIARAVGVESEMELPFAALQQLCAPMLDWLDRLPGPQRAADPKVDGATTASSRLSRRSRHSVPP
jgi:hypothetical protein